MRAKDKKRFNQLKKLNFHNLALHALELESHVDELKGSVIDLEVTKDRLTQQVTDLEASQIKFQDNLKKAVAEIRAKKGGQRFFLSLKLLWSLIGTIEEGFKE